MQVDWKAWNLPDYPILIKKPMDLGTVKKNLKSSKYVNVEEVLSDIQLIWDNCHLYNAPGSVLPLKSGSTKSGPTWRPLSTRVSEKSYRLLR